MQAVMAGAVMVPSPPDLQSVSGCLVPDLWCAGLPWRDFSTRLVLPGDPDRLGDEVPGAGGLLEMGGVVNRSGRLGVCSATASL